MEQYTLIMPILVLMVYQTEAFRQLAPKRTQDLPPLQCHSCSSYSDKDVDCMHSTDTEPDECGEGENVCFKIVIYDYKVTKESDMKAIKVATQVSKGCGKSWWKGCYEKTSNGGRQINCHCDESGCNNADRTKLTAVSVLLFLAVALFLI